MFETEYTFADVKDAKLKRLIAEHPERYVEDWAFVARPIENCLKDIYPEYEIPEDTYTYQKFEDAKEQRNMAINWAVQHKQSLVYEDEYGKTMEDAHWEYSLYYIREGGTYITQCRNIDYEYFGLDNLMFYENDFFINEIGELYHLLNPIKFKKVKSLPTGIEYGPIDFWEVNEQWVHALYRNTTVNGSDYTRINIGTKVLRLDQIVARAWVPNPNNYKHVKHINGDVTDNRACNLIWVPNAERKPRAKETKPRTLSKTAFNKRAVYLMDEKDGIIGVYSSIADAEKKTGCSRYKIKYSLETGYKIVGRYFRYADELAHTKNKYVYNLYNDKGERLRGFDTLKALCEFTGRDRFAIRYAIANAKPINGYIIRKN